AKLGESATDQHLAVGLQREAEHHAVGAGIERGIQAAVRVQPRQEVARPPAELGAWATDQDAAVGLQCAGEHRAVCPRRAAGTGPSGCSARLYPALLAPGSNAASGLPSGFRRGRELRGCPPSWVNWPPTSTLPSGCSAKVRIGPLAPGLKSASRLPSGFSRAR